MHGNIGAFDTGKFRFHLFLARIDKHRGALSKNNFPDFDKSPHIRLTYLVRMQLIYFPFVVENDLEDSLFFRSRHGRHTSIIYLLIYRSSFANESGFRVTATWILKSRFVGLRRSFASYDRFFQVVELLVPILP